MSVCQTILDIIQKKEDARFEAIFETPSSPGQRSYVHTNQAPPHATAVYTGAS